MRKKTNIQSFNHIGLNQMCFRRFYHSMVYGLFSSTAHVGDNDILRAVTVSMEFSILLACLPVFFSQNICLICLRLKLYHLQWIYCVLLSRENRKKYVSKKLCTTKLCIFGFLCLYQFFSFTCLLWGKISFWLNGIK